MFCQNCGAKMESGARFCPSCGTAIGAIVVTSEDSSQITKTEKAEPKWETRSESVRMSEEREYINVYEAFGWEVYSTQDVKTAESHLERRGDAIYSVTQRESYVKLTFRRNKNIPHYKEIVAVEEEYWNAKDSIRHPGELKNGCILYFSAISIFPFIAVVSFYGDAILPGVLAVIGSIVCFVVLKRKTKKHEEAEKAAQKHNEECYEIMRNCLEKVKDYIVD